MVKSLVLVQADIGGHWWRILADIVVVNMDGVELIPTTILLVSIGELKTKYRIHNKKTLECLVTNESDTDKILLGNCDDTDYSTWYIKGNDLISAANDKCLYVDINSNDPALNECGKVNHQTDHQKKQ